MKLYRLTPKGNWFAKGFYEFFVMAKNEDEAWNAVFEYIKDNDMTDPSLKIAQDYYEMEVVDPYEVVTAEI